MLMVDEGASICLCEGVLGASDPDSPPEELTFHLETPPLHGFLENTTPAPGSEKSNAGVRVGLCQFICVRMSGHIRFWFWIGIWFWFL